MSANPRHPSARPAAAAPIYQLKITLADIEPPIWRRITVRGDLRLDRLHAVFQKAMGWQSSHLHEWIVGGRRYGEPEPDEPHYEVEDESRMTLREAAPIEGTRFGYLYDLGDGWTHDVVVEQQVWGVLKLAQIWQTLRLEIAAAGVEPFDVSLVLLVREWAQIVRASAGDVVGWFAREGARAGLIRPSRRLVIRAPTMEPAALVPRPVGLVLTREPRYAGRRCG